MKQYPMDHQIGQMSLLVSHALRVSIGRLYEMSMVMHDSEVDLRF